jgi:hypothetical protein
VTQKVREAEPMRAKLKGKGKVKVIDEAMEEVWKERLAKLKVERAVIQEMIDQLELQGFVVCFLYLFSYHFCTTLYFVLFKIH